MPSSAAATWTSAWVSTPPMTARVSTMVKAIPFMVEGWHAPAGRRTCEPRPLVHVGQIRPATPVGAGQILGPGRQIVSQDNSRRRQPNRRSDRDPGPRPYALAVSPAGMGQKHYPHSPCRIGRTSRRMRGSPVQELVADVLSDRYFEDVWMPHPCGSCALPAAKPARTDTGDKTDDEGGDRVKVRLGIDVACRADHQASLAG